MELDMTKTPRQLALGSLWEIDSIINNLEEDSKKVSMLLEEAKEKKELDCILELYDVEKMNEDSIIKAKCAKERLLLDILDGAYD